MTDQFEMGKGVSPRPGGDTDKFGNRYEGRWTVRQLLEVLVGKAEAITVEPLGEIGAGVEFTLERAVPVATPGPPPGDQRPEDCQAACLASPARPGPRCSAP